MKIRQGFVSNSSSSSFVAVGVKLNRDLLTEELRELADGMDYDVFDDSEQGYDDKDNFVVGRMITYGEDVFMDGVDYSIDNLKSIGESIKGDMNIEDGTVVVIAGTMMT